MTTDTATASPPVDGPPGPEPTAVELEQKLEATRARINELGTLIAELAALQAGAIARGDEPAAERLAAEATALRHELEGLRAVEPRLVELLAAARRREIVADLERRVADLEAEMREHAEQVKREWPGLAERVAAICARDLELEIERARLCLALTEATDRHGVAPEDLPAAPAKPHVAYGDLPAPLHRLARLPTLEPREPGRQGANWAWRGDELDRRSLDVRLRLWTR